MGRSEGCKQELELQIGDYHQILALDVNMIFLQRCLQQQIDVLSINNKVALMQIFEYLFKIRP